jgi:homocysteine S-methyltransferase
VAALERFLARVSHVRIPIIAGLQPLDSLRAAEYMANEVPGVQVPDALVERMRAADAAGAAAAEGLAIARETAARLKDLVRGIQVEVTRRNFETALAVLDEVR